MDLQFQTQLTDWLARTTGATFRIDRITPARGGCIHQSYTIEDGAIAYFVKINHVTKRALFQAEAEALTALAATETIRVPRPIGCGIIGSHSFLVLEHLALGSGNTGDWAMMGRQLAALHQRASDQYGWHQNNFIGASPQDNSHCGEWAEFFRERRLRPQLAMARERGIGFDSESRLLEAVKERLDGHYPTPACLHGDLWS